MNSRMLAMLIPITIVLLIICLFTAKVYSQALQLNYIDAKHLTIASLIIGVLYLFGNFIRKGGNRLSKNAYIAINYVAGVFFYLFLGAIVLGIIDAVLFLTIHTAPVAVGWSILLLSFIAGISGFIQAKNFAITRYTVTLPNLPDSWDGKVAAMVSDTHFGLVNHKKFSDKIVNKILSLNPDMVFHAGDFYDGPIVETASLTESWKKITAKLPLFYTPGNHEAYGDFKLFVDSVRATGATVLDDKVVTHDGVQIAGVLYHTGKESKDVVDMLQGLTLDNNIPSILINHPPTSLHGVSEQGIDLMLSGHTHRGQLWPMRYITRSVYKGYDYGMKKFNNMTVITSNGIGTFGPPTRFLNSPEVVLITFKK